MRLASLSFLSAVLAASTAHSDSPSPPDTLAFISCAAEPRDNWLPHQIPIPGKEYWQLKVNKDNELECKRETIDPQDGSAMAAALKPFDPNFAAITDPGNITFSDYSQCGRVGMMMTARYQEQNPGWLVVAVGCPTPILDDQGTDDTSDDVIIGWQVPQCPTFLPGTDIEITCRFSPEFI